MPTKIEKDSVTGTETTGHEWDGIKELNTPLPKWWLYIFYATIVIALIYCILLPLPLVYSHTGGLLGYSQRLSLEEDLQEAAADRSEYLTQLQSASFEDITGNQQLLTYALAGGEIAFADNCAACHGLGGAGQAGGYPSLADDAWLWGGTFDAIHTTIRHGIRANDDMTRLSQMPTFGGANGMLTRDEIRDVAEHVLSFSDRAEDEKAAERGSVIFAENCSFCHGENGTGIQDFGAPNLTDAIWLYGPKRADIISQVTNPQHGVMPAWSERLSPETIKMVTVYVHSLGGGQ